jgi:radical SAM superfamily enzyme YgiQ (UPF0313 family)
MKVSEKRLMLIEPPFYRLHKATYSLTRYPLGLAYLAGAVDEKTDWDVQVYNADFSADEETMSIKEMDECHQSYLAHLNDKDQPIWDQVREALVEYRPTVIGITSKSQNFRSSRIVAQIAKELNPETVVIIGGPHPSQTGTDSLEYPEFDIAVSGEGEVTLVEILQALEAGEPLESVAGVMYRIAGEIMQNQPRGYIDDMDSLPIPHMLAPRVLRDYKAYPLEAFSYLFATRGCPFACAFCGSREIWTRKVRYRSPENVAREVASLQRMGLKHVHFDDDFFGVNRRYLKALCEALIEHCPEIKWSCEVHVRLVKEDTISWMKAAGCDTIAVGVESGNNEMLKRIQKTTTIEEVYKACDVIKAQKIVLQCFFMVGFPTETEETLQDTFTAMKNIGPAIVAYSIFTPYPGGDMYQECKDLGLIGEDHDCSLFNHQSPANCFTKYIEPARFRELASELEAFVARNNAMYVIRNKSLKYILKRVGDHGIRQSLRKAMDRLCYFLPVTGPSQVVGK